MKKILFSCLSLLLIGTTALCNSQWKKLGGPEGTAVSKMINHNGQIFISTNVSQTPTSIFRSANNGQNWTNVNQQISGSYGRNFVSIGNALYFAQDTTVYMSTNNGTSWNDVSGNLPNYDPITLMGTHNSILFAVAYDGSGFEEMYYSTNSGVSWTSTGFILGLSSSFNQFYSDGNNLWLASGSGVYLSTNNGLSWINKSTNIPFSANVYSIVAKGDTLYCGTSNGVYISTDGANLWMPAQTGLGAQTYATCFLKSGATVYMGTQSEGVFSTTIGNASWQSVGSLFNYAYVTCIALSGNELLIGLLDGFYAFNLSGGAWTLRVNGIVYPTIRAIFAEGPTLLASIGNTRGVYFSSDSGNTWQATTLGNGSYIFGIKKFNSTYFAFSSFNGLKSSGDGINWSSFTALTGGVHCMVSSGNKLIAGTTNGIYQSINSGVSWQAIGSGALANSNVYDVAVSGIQLFACNGSNKIFVSDDAGLTWRVGNGGVSLASNCSKVEVVDGYVLAFTLSTVYRSADFGNTFSLAAFNYFGQPNDTYTSGKNIFAATSQGIVVSDNIGKTWRPWNDGLVPNTTLIYSLFSNATLLYAGTANNGIWKRNFQPELFATVATSSALCAGTSISVNFTSSILFSPGNKFYVQLSDSEGHFGNAVTLDSLTSTIPGTINAVIPTNTVEGTKYRVRVISTLPYVVTQDNGIDFSIGALPSIYLQPANQQVCSGANSGFYIGAQGSGISYQWQVNTGGANYNNLSNSATYQGVNDSLLIILTTSASMNSYKYRCVINGICGLPLVSSFGQLTIVSNTVTVLVAPSPVTICDSSNASFTISASGSPLSYQWQAAPAGTLFFSNLSNSILYSGVTTNTLLVSTATGLLDGYRYRCVIGTCVESSDALLTVNGKPVSTAPVSNVLVCSGDTARVNVFVPGSGITYQWQENTGNGFTNIINNSTYSGANSTQLKIANFTNSSNGYQYQCVISGACVPFISNSAVITVLINSTTAQITQQPIPKTVCENLPVFFNLQASGAGLTYAWQYNNGFSWLPIPVGAPYSGINSDTLKISIATSSLNNYQYRCQVSACTESTPVGLIVNPRPVVNLNQLPSIFCNTGVAVTLNGGTPGGGSYFGSGISNSQFVPAAAGVGSIPITYLYTNASGCQAQATQNLTVNFCAPLSLNESTENTSDWLLFPNPSSDFIQLKNKSGLSEKVQIGIYNVLGELVFQKQLNNENDIFIDVTKFNAGVYLIIIESPKQTFNLKFLVSY